MRLTSNRKRLLLSIFMFAIVGFLLLWQWPVLRGQGGSCAVGTYLEATLPTGARWDLCWSSEPKEGIVLREIYYSTPAGLRRKILQEASLAQIEVRYDDGMTTLYPVSKPGLGDVQLLTLDTADCPNGTLLSQSNWALLCQQIAGRGYLNKYYTQQRQGDLLTLLSASQVGQQTYIVQWHLYDDGTIEPQVGEGGRDLRPVGYITNYWWRIDFDIGGNGANDFVDEFEVNPTTSNTQRISSAVTLNSESGRTTDPDKKRSWRVRDGSLTNSDGHAISYHLDPKEVGYRDPGSAAAPWNTNDFYATVAHPCERMPVRNPSAGGCPDNVAGFVNGESLAGADVVLWYRITAHRLPRAEDEPLLDVQWHSFQLLQRDWTAQSPF
ncbi:MAG: hypothetical protein U0175_26480 [Caldilineaceae bacterium]